jgi:xanthine dehydrogenase accessory factor
MRSLPMKAQAMDLENVLGIAAAWHKNGERVALATVTQTWGSSPRPAGSRMAMTESGKIEGSVSGGCIEGAVVQAALQSLQSGIPALLDFSVTNELAWEVGLACGGTVKVFVEPFSMKPAMLAGLADAATARRPMAFAKRLTDAAEFLLPDPAAPDALNAAGSAALAAEKTGTETISGEAWFIEVRHPAPRLVVVGAVHIAQVLAPLAAMMGFAVTMVDPRRAFNNSERFPGVALCHEWPDAALNGLSPDPRTAVVTLTHDPKLDDPALDRALHSEAFYIGALGSRKTHAARLARLRAAGHGDAALERIRGPVGLDIGAVSAPEIALSIMAEIVAVLRHGGLGARTA